MKRSTKITMVVSAAVVAGLLVLAAPVFVGAASWASGFFGSGSAGSGPVGTVAPTDEPGTDDSDVDESAPDDGLVYLGDGTWVPEGGPGDCTASARISIRAEDNEPYYSKLLGEIVEMGPSELASGEVRKNDDGEIYAYVVAPGDSPIAIGERFCIDYTTVQAHNHVRIDINPGDVLYLRPDPTLPWIDPFSPFDVQPGEQTGPYYDAIDFMRNAVVAKDLAEAQRVWAGLGPRVHPAAREIAARALEAGDWELLRQMFP